MNNSNNVKSIGSNIRSIIKTAINIPLELTSVALEVTNDATQLTSATIRGAVPTTKAVVSATGRFAVGASNPSLNEKELEDKLDHVNFANVRDNMLKSSARAGQSTSKAILDFFEE